MLLKKSLQANACFSFVCAVILLSFSSSIAPIMGELPQWLYPALGIGLLVFAADIVWISRQLPKGQNRAQIIFAADVAWVVLTPIVLWMFAPLFSVTGVMIMVDIAVIVALFAFAEWKGLQQLDKEKSDKQALAA